MIKKLRLKFIGISMASVLIVLFVIVAAINYLNYKEVISDADHTLALLKDNNGVFPKSQNQSGPKDENKSAHSDPLSPEAPFESRYFSVLLNSTGTASSVDTGKIASIDSSEAINYAQTIWTSSNEKGFISDYRYVKQEISDGTRIIFLYCGKSLANFRSFLFSSIFVSVLGIFAVMILVILLSKRILKPVAESYEKQKRFISDAGHEIKTPLTIIDADVSILEMEHGESEWLSDIQLQTRRLTGLTNDLICLSRMEEANNSFTMIDFPISDIVAETAQSFQSLATLQHKHFTVQAEPLLTCHGDEKSIRQLTSILLDNALKYSEEDGFITLTLEKRGRTIHLSVCNTTPYISPDSLPRLFDRFYRTDPSRNSQTGGYGIGLSLAKAIVTSHKGKIIPTTTPDQKTLTITVTL